MNWITSLFSSDATLDKSVNLIDDSVRGVGSWIDNMSFTEQEKAVANKDLLNFRLKVLENTAAEGSPRSLFRTRLAWRVANIFFFFLLLSALGVVLEAEWMNDILAIAELMYYPFLTVGSFYFVSDIGGNWIDKSKKK